MREVRGGEKEEAQDTRRWNTMWAFMPVIVGVIEATQQHLVGLCGLLDHCIDVGVEDGADRQ